MAGWVAAFCLGGLLEVITDDDVEIGDDRVLGSRYLASGKA